MAWEYLNLSEFQIRYRLAAALINGHPDINSPVVDLNCGENAPLWEYIDDAYYWGNDILLNVEVDEPTRCLKKITDDLVPEQLGNYMTEIGTLVLLGDGAGEYTGQAVESKTAFDTLKKLVENFSPLSVLHEGVELYEKEYGILTRVEKALFEYGYKQEMILKLDFKEKDLGFVAKREMRVYIKE